MTIIKQPDKPQVIVTDDGSSTIYLSDLDETYHSKFGAINEANHVFIDNGLAKIKKGEVHILEIGFGTGLNALLSLLFALKNKIRIDYTSIEKFPLEGNIVASLNYAEKIKGSDNFFSKIHEVEWESSHQISDYFTLKKIQADVLDKALLFPVNMDLIYFDAFAPSKQKELWNTELFEKLYACLNTNGKLVTYSAAGIVKQALRNAGFIVKRLPGPPGKHHMIVAYRD